MITLTKENVGAALRDIVEEYGVDHRYNVAVEGDANGDYVYVRQDDSPSCILGHVLIRLGVSADAFRIPMIGGDTESQLVNTTRFAKCSDLLPIEFAEPNVFAAMVDAQDKQDTGNCWGAALASAEYHLAKVTP